MFFIIGVAGCDIISRQRKSLRCDDLGRYGNAQQVSAICSAVSDELFLAVVMANTKSFAPHLPQNICSKVEGILLPGCSALQLMKISSRVLVFFGTDQMIATGDRPENAGRPESDFCMMVICNAYHEKIFWQENCDMMNVGMKIAHDCVTLSNIVVEGWMGSKNDVCCHPDPMTVNEACFSFDRESFYHPLQTEPQ